MCFQFTDIFCFLQVVVFGATAPHWTSAPHSGGF